MARHWWSWPLLTSISPISTSNESNSNMQTLISISIICYSWKFCCRFPSFPLSATIAACTKCFVIQVINEPNLLKSSHLLILSSKIHNFLRFIVVTIAFHALIWTEFARLSTIWWQLPIHTIITIKGSLHGIVILVSALGTLLLIGTRAWGVSGWPTSTKNLLDKVRGIFHHVGLVLLFLLWYYICLIFIMSLSFPNRPIILLFPICLVNQKYQIFQGTMFTSIHSDSL